MTATERLDLIEKALELPHGDEETAYEILKIILSGLKVRHLKVTLTQLSPMKTDIAVELDGIEFKTSHVSVEIPSDEYVFDACEDYGRRYLKKVK